MNTDDEQTLVLIKPDAIQRNLIGIILSRLETKGLKLIGLKLLQLDEDLARRLYEVHIDKPFFMNLVQFIKSKPIIAMLWQGRHATAVVRQIMGTTDSAKAAPGSIRGDFGLDLGMNLIHGSDSRTSADREIPLFFSSTEIHDYDREVDRWIKES